ncbi:PREDICTED: uncharacterized protein LOC104605810 isoform X4 [Nelumbo nucifera]|uniref:Uncharacterized protein LOC104605810 isoform X4 n=1 Tax=Nelumbo nucifera TaxID=4432 RepID=A0A1U8ANB1_NELNU|nr:PREDICTED: uncharacterized protein LOC104605810 isoform X4 [Nelumbo nucifera]
MTDGVCLRFPSDSSNQRLQRQWLIRSLHRSIELTLERYYIRDLARGFIAFDTVTEVQGQLGFLFFFNKPLKISSASAREKELQSQVISLQQSIGNLVEELQRQKIINSQKY